MYPETTRFYGTKLPTHAGHKGLNSRVFAPAISGVRLIVILGTNPGCLSSELGVRLPVVRFLEFILTSISVTRRSTFGRSFI